MKANSTMWTIGQNSGINTFTVATSPVGVGRESELKPTFVDHQSGWSEGRIVIETEPQWFPLDSPSSRSAFLGLPLSVLTR
jgi:hypothetical protein